MGKKLKLRRFRLKQDIVIPAGTVLEQRSGTVHYTEMYQSGVSVSKDTSGTLTYGIDLMDPEMEAWFEEIGE